MYHIWVPALACAAFAFLTTLGGQWKHHVGKEVDRAVGIPRRTCIIPATGKNTGDDAPAIIDAFKQCGYGGRVIFQPTTYYINTVMNISWLEDVEIDIYGTLEVSSYINIPVIFCKFNCNFIFKPNSPLILRDLVSGVSILTIGLNTPYRSASKTTPLHSLSAVTMFVSMATALALFTEMVIHGILGLGPKITPQIFRAGHMH
jgi:hypothetical protein